jgi:hypothetical protein
VNPNIRLKLLIKLNKKRQENFKNMKFSKIFCALLSVLSVTSYKIADISVFGNCVRHIKRFHDSKITVDITSLVVIAQSRTKSQPTVSIFSANETQSIKPTGTIREECSLQIIIGLLPSDSRILYSFMYDNPYTYSSRPNSIYVIILGPFTKSVVIYDHSIWLPVSIFTFKVATLNVVDDPYLSYFCLSCKNLIQPVINNELIRFVNEYTYEKEWKQASLNVQAISFAGDKDVTGCERNIWKKWLGSKDDPERASWTHCNKPANVCDLILRSVHPNITTSFQAEINTTKPGFSGSFAQKFFYRTSRPLPWEVSSSIFHGFGICGIIYCDCLRRCQSTSLATWSIGFGKYEWASILCTTLVTSAIVCCRVFLHSKPRRFMSYVGSIVNIVGIVLRQGSYQGFLLAIFSLGMYMVSLLFENALMSGLVVPDKDPVLDVAELIDAGYRILFHGEMNGFNSHLPFLLDELIKFNVTYNESMVRSANTLIAGPSTFANETFSSFFVSTPAGKQLVQEEIKNMVPKYCVCSSVRNEFTKFPVYSFFHHKLKFQILQRVQFLTDAGFNRFLDWDLQRTASDFRIAPRTTQPVEASFDSFISLNNLAPLLVFNGCLLLLSTFVFTIECKSRVCLICETTFVQ